MSSKFNTLAVRISELEKKYFLSGKYFRNLNRFFTIPSIILTSCASIFSYLSTSQYSDGESKNIFLLSVTITSALSTLLQTISINGQFLIKKERYMEAANELNSLADNIYFETLFANEEDFLTKIEEDIKEIKNKCKFLPVY